MELRERIEKEKELLNEMRMVRKLAAAVSILTVLLIGSNAVWIFLMLH